MVVAFFIEGRGMPNANLAAMKAKGYLQTKDKKNQTQQRQNYSEEYKQLIY